MTNHIELFERKVLCASLDPQWFKAVWAHMLPDYFENASHRNIASVIANHHKQYGTHVSDTAELYALCKAQIDRKELPAVASVLESMDSIGSVTVAKDLFIKWVIEQAAKNAVLDSIDDIRAGKLDIVAQRIKEASNIATSYDDPGIDLIDDVEKWVLSEHYGDRIPTGWTHSDSYIGGGLKRGELGVILSPSNRGKSMALANIAMGAAGIGNPYNVVIFTHEMSSEIYAKRLGARVLFEFPNEHYDPYEYIDDFKVMAKRVIRGKVKIVKFKGKTKPSMLEGYVERLIDQGFKPDVIIDDYLDLLYPETHRHEKRFELSDLYRWFRDWCDELDCAGWTASQSTRDSYDRELITEKDIAEDIGKVAIADYIVALCQTRKEAQKRLARLYWAKIRDGAMRGAMFDMKYKPEQQALISIGHTKVTEEKDEVR